MEAASPAAQDVFQTDLRAALTIASKSTGSRYRRDQSNTFGMWVKFCAELGVPPSLSTVPTQEDKLSYLLVFGYRYRRQGTRNIPVRADTVDKALLAVGQGIADLGQLDPRKGLHSDKFHPVYASFLKAMRDEDDPAERAYPVNVAILRNLPRALDFEHPIWGPFNVHVADLIIVGFFWLLRPSEYLFPTNKESRTQAFLFQHIHLTIGGRPYSAPTAPLHDETDLARISHAELEFTDQKNAVKGERVGHRPTSDSFLCGVKALGRIALRLRRLKAAPNTPLYNHYNSHPDHACWYSVKSKHVTNALRHSATPLQTHTGIAPSLLTTRSLRPGGATALLCSRVDTDAIRLLGRWKSDAMFRYLRIQAAVHTHNYAQRMLDNGAFTFSPSTYAQLGLPHQAPDDVAALLHHNDLYAD